MTDNPTEPFSERWPSFTAWMAELDRLHSERGAPYGDGPLATTTGKDCWRCYFDDEYSPCAALDEDLSYD